MSAAIAPGFRSEQAKKLGRILHHVRSFVNTYCVSLGLLHQKTFTHVGALTEASGNAANLSPKKSKTGNRCPNLVVPAKYR